MKALLLLPLVVLSTWASPQLNKQPGGSGLLCGICEAAITEAEKYAFNTEPELQSFLDGECDKLTSGWLSFLDGPCKDLVKTYLPELYQALQNKLPPQQVCTDIHACSSFAPAFSAEAVKQKPRRKMGQQLNLECSVCEGAIKYLDNQLATSNVMSTLEGYFLQACNVVPEGEERTICQNVITQYFPDIWAKIIALLDPAQICTELKLCGSRQGLRLDSIGCSFCKTVFTWFQNYIMTPANEQKILAEVTSVCQKIPNMDYAQKCTSVLDKYGDELFQEVNRLLGPNNICQAVHACPSS